MAPLRPIHLKAHPHHGSFDGKICVRSGRNQLGVGTQIAQHREKSSIPNCPCPSFVAFACPFSGEFHFAARHGRKMFANIDVFRIICNPSIVQMDTNTSGQHFSVGLELKVSESLFSPPQKRNKNMKIIIRSGNSSAGRFKCCIRSVCCARIEHMDYPQTRSVFFCPRCALFKPRREFAAKNSNRMRPIYWDNACTRHTCPCFLNRRGKKERNKQTNKPTMERMFFDHFACSKYACAIELLKHQ